MRDLVRRKAGRRSWTFAIAVPRDLVGLVIGRSGKPVRVVERQLAATDHAGAVREAGPLRVETLNRFEEIRFQRAKARADSESWSTGDSELRAGARAYLDTLERPAEVLGTAYKYIGPGVADLAESYIEDRASLTPKTRYQIRAALASLAKFHPLGLDKLDRRRVERWKDSMTGEPATVNAALSKASRFWRWAYDRGHVGGENPFARQWKEDTPDAKREAFTAEEVQRLIDRPSAIRWHIIAAALSGLRAAELVSARLEPDAFIVEKSKTPAGKRVVPFHPILKRLKFAKQWPAANTLSASELSKRFTRHRRAVGIPDSKPEKVFHSLRHFFATAARDTGEISEPILGGLMGHVGGFTVRTYARKSVEFRALAAAVRKIEYPGLKL